MGTGTSSGKAPATGAGGNAVSATQSTSSGNPKYDALPQGTKDLLAEGNTYTFAHTFLDMYPQEAAAAGFDFSAAVNKYKTYIDYNDGIYTFRHPNGDKDFFDTKMRFRGRKTY